MPIAIGLANISVLGL